MKKYFKEGQPKKLILSDYLSQVEKEYNKILEEIQKHRSDRFGPRNLEMTEREVTLKRERIKHIYKTLGEVQISEEILETICKSFDVSKCRYGTVCLQPGTIKALYEISEMFPELSQEALLSISREYIKDLFDENLLLETLCMMLRKDGQEDSTFEKFMETVKKLADEEEKKYEQEAWYLRICFGQYSYDFIEHFQEFIKQHHITCQQLGESLPDPGLFLEDQMQLKEISSRAKECWSCCTPISFQLLEAYLDGDRELSRFDEQPTYYISVMNKSFPATFTKTEFLERIKKQQRILKR